MQRHIGLLNKISTFDLSEFIRGLVQPVRQGFYAKNDQLKIKCLVIKEKYDGQHHTFMWISAILGPGSYLEYQPAIVYKMFPEDSIFLDPKCDPVGDRSIIHLQVKKGEQGLQSQISSFKHCQNPFGCVIGPYILDWFVILGHQWPNAWHRHHGGHCQICYLRSFNTPHQNGSCVWNPCFKSTVFLLDYSGHMPFFQFFLWGDGSFFQNPWHLWSFDASGHWTGYVILSLCKLYLSLFRWYQVRQSIFCKIW